MSSQSKTSCNSDTNNILLIGSNCINNQFFQREIEKHSVFCFARHCPQEIEKAHTAQTPDIVLISYPILVNTADISTALAKVLSNKWIVYDVPRDKDEQAIQDIQQYPFITLKGIIYHDAPIEHLTRCLKAVVDGDFWLPRKIMAQMLSEARPYALKIQETQNELTKREQQVFKKLIEGASNLEISEDLYISESTVKTHIYKIYKKLNVANRKEAIRKAAYISDLEFS
ncbi:response regulator transcription factor [Marinomonas ostreistagni]|uniref:response regulator transcription factor n=1 Tax=Marinomonas ostreistagni TaxID=359209 RepID=UPI0019500AB3|nr:response regulator transcription factor [Marinomonas ostreistagni]MBM6549900.1 response regulator transcription factor [Marinomonas ostreistagni]